MDLFCSLGFENNKNQIMSSEIDLAHSEMCYQTICTMGMFVRVGKFELGIGAPRHLTNEPNDKWQIMLWEHRASWVERRRKREKGRKKQHKNVVNAQWNQNKKFVQTKAVERQHEKMTSIGCWNKNHNNIHSISVFIIIIILSFCHLSFLCVCVDSSLRLIIFRNSN